jgi:hypothetical protein
VFRLYEALQRWKLDWAKDEHNGIVESKLEQPTLSPDDLRPMGKWIEVAMRIKCSVCGTDFNDEVTCCSNCYRWPWNYCPNCGAKMKGAEDGTTDNP